MAMTDECNTGSHEVCLGIFEEEESFAISCACGCHATIWPTGHVPIGLPATEVQTQVMSTPLAAPEEESLSEEEPAEVPAPA